jgi:hypothetical protein
LLIYKYTPSATTVSGAWSGNTERMSGGLCRQVYVKSATSTTTFDVSLTDEDDIEIRTWEDQTGEVNDLTPFLIRGKYTFAISSATADEAFTVMMCVNDG